MKESVSEKRMWLYALIAALVVGVGLRVVAFRQVPPGLYRDEAFTGADGLHTLEEGPRMFYPVSFGREPLFTWLVALSVGLWGPSPLAVRFPSLVIGILTLLTTYAMTRELFNRRTAVLATAVLAVMLWHVHFSRLGFRAILIPLLASTGVWLVARGVRTGRRWPWIAGGAMAGALLYTYISGRAAVVPAVLLLLYAWWRRRSLRVPRWRNLLLFGLTAVVVMAPFLTYALMNWEEVFLRTQNVESVFNVPNPWGLFFENTLRTLGMFLFQGDPQFRHNLPLRPIFDPALGVAFLLGLGLTIRRSRRDYAAVFLLLWTTTMLLPTLLTVECPHFIRSIGLLPFIAIFPALGLEWIWEWSAHSWTRRRASAVMILILCAGLLSTVSAYFFRYPAIPETCYRFECEGVEMASEVNAYLEAGWTEGDWFVRDLSARTDRQVFVQFQLWKDLVNAHYLIPDSPAFNVPGESFIESAPPRPDLPMMYYGWYNQYYPEYWVSDLDWLPPNSLIEVYEGPMAITHQDWTPHPAYVKFVATPTELPDDVLAELDQGIRLVRSCTQQEDGRVTVRLIWYNSAPIPVDYTVFVHYERDGQIVAQTDAPPGKGYYPPSRWRQGDQFLDERSLDVSEIQAGDRIWAGMYFWQTGERLPVLSATVPTEDHRILIDLRPCETSSHP